MAIELARPTIPEFIIVPAETIAELRAIQAFESSIPKSMQGFADDVYETVSEVNWSLLSETSYVQLRDALEGDRVELCLNRVFINAAGNVALDVMLEFEGGFEDGEIELRSE